MKKQLIKLKNNQLSMSLEKGLVIPVERIGMLLSDIRKSLSLTQRQMAQKLGVSQPAVRKIEKNASASSFKTLSKIYSVLNCELSIIVRSRESLNATIKKQANKKATQLLKQAYSNMAMEKQSPGIKTYEKRLNELAEELASNPDSSLWED